MNEPSPYLRADSVKAASGRVGFLLVCTVAILVVGSALLWSSPEFRTGHLLLASLAATWFAPRLLGPLLPGIGWGGVAFGCGLLLVHVASWTGGLAQGDPGWLVSARTLAGVLGVSGLAVFSVVLLAPRWRGFVKWSAWVVLGLMLAGSYVIFFIGIEHIGKPVKYAFQFVDLRMGLVWPTRLLTQAIGQIAWEHANCGAFYFGLALAMVLEYLGSGRKGLGWRCLVILLGGAVFLTASRGGWLMVLMAVPLILVGRKPRFALETIVLLALAVCFGFACLKTKQALTPPVDGSRPVTTATHSSGLVNRADAGRLLVYQMVWHEIENNRLCGKGLGAVNKPVGQLEHEHSVFIASLRGGGLVGLFGHLLVIGSASWAALRLMRRGLRWPMVLLATTLSGLMFDRSTAIGISGHYEFIVHWVALSLPLILLASWQPAAKFDER